MTVERTKRSWKIGLAALPGVAVSLLPNLACPACWPAYAGIMSSLGLGFLMDSTWLLPLTAVFLAVAVGALAFRARRRRGYWPFLLGSLASAVVLGGKFLLEIDAMMYIGVALLVSASVWNSWPVKRKVEACDDCGCMTEDTR